MRGPERIVLLLALVVPLVIAGVGWPLLVRWLADSGAAAPQSEVAGAVATATPAPATPEAVPTTTPRAPTAAPVVPEATRVSQGAQADTGPTAAVATFYELVGRHEFDTAAQLWTPRMRAAFPPAENIDQRFAQTQQVIVKRVEVESARGDTAVVSVDLDEQQAAGRRHYVGTWSVVHDGTSWLLDQPNLEAAP